MIKKEMCNTHICLSTYLPSCLNTYLEVDGYICEWMSQFYFTFVQVLLINPLNRQGEWSGAPVAQCETPV